MIPFGYGAMQPIYPCLIQQFLDDYGLDKGIAVDIGTGPGNLAVELAKATDMELILVDLDRSALDTARERLDRIGADNRVSFVCADVEDLPLKEGLADFVMSRGSVGFWKHPARGLAEIRRILRPGGTAIVGVGSGRYLPPTLRRRIYERMNATPRPGRPPRYTAAEYEAFAWEAGLTDYRVIMEDALTQGGWIEFRKPR